MCKCSKYQQLKLAKYCEDILDEYLLRRPLDNMPVTIAAFIVDNGKCSYFILSCKCSLKATPTLVGEAFIFYL